jgi:hypothetical protein
MPRLALSRRKQRDLDRLTFGLGVVAAGTAGTVVIGELLRLGRRRLQAAETDEGLPEHAGVLETAEQALLSTGLATQDTVSVAIEGFKATPRHETVLFNLLAGFVGSLSFVRLSTHGMRAGWWPLGNVRVGGRHIHHFVPGILIAFGSGAAALFTANEKLEETLAVPFGIGLGLTLDEAALLLDLEDVYWTPEGVLSLQLSLGAAALMGGTILALRILRRGEREVEAQGAMPAPRVYVTR